MRKGAPVDRSLEKAPHSPAGFSSALVLLVQCWWSCRRHPHSCTFSTTTTPELMCPPSALHVLGPRWLPGPQTSAYGVQTPEPDLHCGLSWGSAGVDTSAWCSLLTLPSPTGLNHQNRAGLMNVSVRSVSSHIFTEVLKEEKGPCRLCLT